MPEASSHRERRAAGLSLMEVAIVVTVLGIVLGAGLEVLRPQVVAANRESARGQVATIAAALELYAARHERLPCPSDVTAQDAADSFSNDGRPQPAGPLQCAAGDAISGVPWRALGLPQEAAIDPWGRQIAYRVYNANDGLTRTQGDFPGSRGMSAQHCACPGPDCLASGPDGAGLRDCDPDDDTDHLDDWLRDKGLTVQDPSGDPVMQPGNCPQECGGAAFVLIAYGPNGNGAYTGAGGRMPLPPGGSNEAINTTFDGTYMTALGLTPPDATFDDFVLARSIDSVTAAAELRP